MGCDMTMRFEVKFEIDGEEEWRNRDYYQLNPFYDTDDTYWNRFKYEVKQVYEARDYELFATLANVRNGGGITPAICAPKGMPDDASDETFLDHKIMAEDNKAVHSLTYFTLGQLRRCRKKYPALHSLICAFDLRMREEFEMDEDEHDIYQYDEDCRIIIWFDS